LTLARRNQLVITCEHGGREVPREYAALFSDRAALLDSHRGWDAGALELGRQLADAFGVPLHVATTTRLLVDLNRSIGHRQLFSEVTARTSSIVTTGPIATRSKPTWRALSRRASG